MPLKPSMQDNSVFCGEGESRIEGLSGISAIYEYSGVNAPMPRTKAFHANPTIMPITVCQGCYCTRQGSTNPGACQG